MNSALTPAPAWMATRTASEAHAHPAYFGTSLSHNAVTYHWVGEGGSMHDSGMNDDALGGEGGGCVETHGVQCHGMNHQLMV